jgi:hypothetical protein
MLMSIWDHIDDEGNVDEMNAFSDIPGVPEPLREWKEAYVVKRYVHAISPALATQKAHNAIGALRTIANHSRPVSLGSPVEVPPFVDEYAAEEGLSPDDITEGLSTVWQVEISVYEEDASIHNAIGQVLRIIIMTLNYIEEKPNNNVDDIPF